MSDDEMDFSYEGPEDDECLLDNSEAEEDIDFKQPKLLRQNSFEVLDQEALRNELRDLDQGLEDVLGVSSDAVANVLLKHFNWNKDKVIEEYATNPDRVAAAAGIPGLQLETPCPASIKTFSCAICLETVPADKTYALSCGHRYCKLCWKEYLEVKLKDGPGVVHTTCPWPKCKVVVHSDAFSSLLKESDRKLYQKYLLKCLVEDNPKTKWCPAPGCDNVVRSDRIKRKEPVACKCGFSFCFTCCDYAVGDHVPATCDQVERWLQKASDESENVTWMMANTKKCPHCRSPIEKNGGCMHMTCNRVSGGCGFEFCWLCRGPWSEHGSHSGGYYDCNKYDKSKAKDEDTKAADIKTELEQYMFFYHRYEAHKNAGKIADDQRRSTDRKSRMILEKYEVRSTDTKFLGEATEQLIANRRVLQWSYVMGYYSIIDREKSTERNLFEYLQEDLEKHTNHLSELYETTLDEIQDYHAFIKWKEEVTNYTRVTKKFLDNFLEGVMGGLIIDA